MGVQDDAERFEPAGVAEWSAWLAEHHADTPGVWLVTARRAADRNLDYEDAVLEALRYGWVDAVRRVLDDDRSMLWFSPRRRSSIWARSNKERIARLQAEGRLEPAGRAAVEAPHANGMWTLLDDVDDLVVPDDLAAALADRPGARERFDDFPPSVRKQALGHIALARRPATRAARIAETAARAERGERPG